MTAVEMASIAIGVLGLAGTAWGIYFGLDEKRKRQRMERKLQGQLWGLLERALYASGNHLLIKEFHQELSHPKKYYLINIHQASCDLYKSLVELYLSQEEVFTYERLQKMHANGLLLHWWEEKIWRDLICQRPENLHAEVPDYFNPKNTELYGADAQMGIAGNSDELVVQSKLQS